MFNRLWWINTLGNTGANTHEDNGMYVPAVNTVCTLAQLRSATLCQRYTRSFAIVCLFRFEVNAIGTCKWRGVGKGGGDAGDMPAHVCQLFPGIFQHQEVDGRR
jgi:hypothetical protein